jgi:dTDP-glucose 4,6-dehydratase
MNILVTGGAGFIGSALIHHLIRTTEHNILNFDALTYAANLDALKKYDNSTRYRFVKGDICDQASVEKAFDEFKPTAIMHLAAESHVDRSIESAIPFLQTNVVGTVMLLTAALKYWKNLEKEKQKSFRFHHISTDEVYGTLGKDGLFTEQTAYDPRSPYSASKAASDHFVSAFYHTYGLPIVITNCSNNYGPNQFPEKLIPLTISKCLHNEKIPVYGKGINVRDWLYVDDHAEALFLAITNGNLGEKYNIGGDAERQNIEVVKTICTFMDQKHPKKEGLYQDLIHFVDDRPGHDKRYAIDHTKITNAYGWKPKITFEEGISRTIDWYLSNQDWLLNILHKSYDGGRIGLQK